MRGGGARLRRPSRERTLWIVSFLILSFFHHTELWVLGATESVPNNLAVDSAGHTVLQLQVHLGDGVVGEDGSLGDIT